MVTTNSVVNRPLISPDRTENSIAGTSEKLSAKKYSNTPQANPGSQDPVVNHTKDLGIKLAANSRINSLAETIRATDNAMEEIGRTIGKMKQALEGIVKNYPPYPQGSIERAEKLKSFNGLRTLIDRLTFPPEPENTAASAPQYPAIKIENQQVDSGSDGLNLRQLPADAGDTVIYDAISRLDNANATIQQKLAGLNKTAGAIAQEFFPEQIAPGDGQNTTKTDGKNFEEVVAELKSLEVKKIFRQKADISAVSNHTQLMEFMK